MSLPSSSVQQSGLTASLNASNISTFLMGSYAVVYLHTLYLYLTRKEAPQRLVVLGAITVLFLIASIQLAIDWYIDITDLPQAESNRLTAYVALFQMPHWTHIANSVAAYTMFTVADGLLIWRCFHVYGRRRLFIILPLFLLTMEIGLFIASITYFLIVNSNATQNEIDIYNDMQSALFFVSFATSSITTGLIAHKIYTSSRNINGTKKRFMHILEIIIQSALVYSAASLVAAISGAVPDGDSWPSPAVFALANYSSSILTPSAGMAPTIMAARVALASSQDETSQSRHPQLTRLEFQRSNDTTTRSHFGIQPHFTFRDANSVEGRESFSGEDKIELA